MLGTFEGSSSFSLWRNIVLAPFRTWLLRSQELSQPGEPISVTTFCVTMYSSTPGLLQRSSYVQSTIELKCE